MGIVSDRSGYYVPDKRLVGEAPGPGKPKQDPMFDNWLKHHLSSLYDPVIQEPIPSDLLRLLEERLG
jgi:hypothetical protein